LLLSCAQAHPLVQSSPPYTSMPALIVTASPNGALVQAYTRLPALAAFVIASPSLAKGLAIDPSPPAGASACAKTPQSAVTFTLLGSPAHAGLLPSPPPSFHVASFGSVSGV